MRCLLLLLVIAAAPCTAGARAGEPTSRPASETPAKVLIQPFEPIGPAGQQLWIGQAIQESLRAELSRAAGLEPVIAPRSTPAERPQQAHETAERSGARFALIGSYQVVGRELRITGQVLDIRDGSRAVGGLKATGTTGDLFSLEDTLAVQAKRTLIRLTTPAAVTSITAEADKPAVVQANGRDEESIQLGVGVYAGEVPEWAPFSPPARSTVAYDRYRFGPYSFPYWYCGYPYLGCWPGAWFGGGGCYYGPDP